MRGSPLNGFHEYGRIDLKKKGAWLYRIDTNEVTAEQIKDRGRDMIAGPIHT